MPSPDLHSYPLQTSLSIGPSGWEGGDLKERRASTNLRRLGRRPGCSASVCHRSTTWVMTVCTGNAHRTGRSTNHIASTTWSGRSDWVSPLPLFIISDRKNCISKPSIIAVLHLARHWVAESRNRRRYLTSFSNQSLVWSNDISRPRCNKRDWFLKLNINPKTTDRIYK